ncbi:zinc finger protein OZF-like [Entelurus aequoreus]|uniref:zinc finger protein OZF-like n=1 Tax=Entelurus aequoreus TaxID=161455 RepID=UPI002B1E553B|nr:zinc finger protein OZF-like [Entelurus aequoreus]
MDYAKMATSGRREHERESAPTTSSKSPTEIKTRTVNKDVQQLIGHQEELLTQSGGSSTLKPETPQPPHIKKEEEELWITQEGECLLGPHEADLTKLPLTIVSVKIEDDEDKPQVDNPLAPLSDSEAEDEVGQHLRSDTDCEDVQQQFGHPEELPHQSRRSSTLKQETPQPPHIKKEEEELWITQEGECLLGPPEDDLTKLPLTVVFVKTEDDEEKPQPDNDIAPLSDCEAEDKVEEPLSSGTDCEGDFITQTNNKHFECSKKKKGKKRLSSSVWAKSFSKQSNLTEYIRTHTVEKTFTCTVCGKSFSRNSFLTAHMRTHTGEKPFNCSVCCKSFSMKCSLTEHMRTHTGEKPFNCSVCAKLFTSKSNLTQHMRTHTAEKPFSCLVCGKSFPQNGYLAAHMRTHTGEKPFNCSVCGKSFSMKCSLTDHMRTHTGEKPFNCLVCAKCFSSKSNLTQHMSIHTGEKRFSCSVCAKRFPQNSYLTAHMRTHTGERPFNCSVCDKSFSQKRNLIQHMITHTGQKPFNCSVCSKTFSQKIRFTQHLRTHTGEKPFNCSVCVKSFFTRQGLTKHKMKHDGE